MKIFIITNGPGTIKFRLPLILEMKKFGKVYVLFSFLDAYSDKVQLEKMGVHCLDTMQSQHGFNFLKEYKMYKRLLFFMSQYQPDLILNYTIKPIVWGGIASRRYKLVKNFSFVPGRGRILAETNNIVKRTIQIIVQCLIRFSLYNSQKVFFLNNEDKAYFLRKKLLKIEQCFVLKSEGLELEHYRQDKRFPDGIMFFMAARLMRDKGVFEFLLAANKISKKYNNVCFKLAGKFDSSMSKLDIQKFHELVSIDNFEYVGWVDDVLPYMKASSVYVLPSYYEGCSYSILEAMAIGRPILTTDVRGCRESIVVGVNGYLVPAKNVNALARKMELFISKKEQEQFFSKMGNEGRKIVEKYHDSSSINKDIMRVLGLY